MKSLHSILPHHTTQNKTDLTIGFIGNPNCGKTTLFNAFTGANLKVANWPGVTVEKVEGAIHSHNRNIRLVDLPGTYSLTSYTMEETVARNFILSGEVDVIINVVDASALERSLYLTLQLLELGKPVVMALNMMDIVLKRGMEIDLHRLPEMLGIPVIPVSARKRMGLDILLHAAIHHQGAKTPDPIIHEHKETFEHKHDHHQEFAMVYSDFIEDKIDQIIPRLQEKYPNLINYRYYAIKTLEGDHEISSKYPIDTQDIFPDGKNFEARIINEKYDFIDDVITEVLVNKERQDKLTEKIDKVFTHPFFGIPAFLAIMAVVFILTFNFGDFIKGFFEIAIDLISTKASDYLSSLNASPMLISLIVEGIIGGVGVVITFLPNLFVLFLALAFLEDTGYMARVAYVMEGIMKKLGLSGRAFIPMILGFGCSVPAIMATRALEHRHDKLKVMLVTPFMSCNARLTIYVLFSEMFFHENAMIVAYSLYLIGIVVALIVCFILKFLDRKGSLTNYLLIELPAYKLPDLHTVSIYVWDKLKDYLSKAGTTIFVMTLAVWALLHFGSNGFTLTMSDSFGAVVGQALSPLFAPLGLGFWQIVLALIAGIVAKEVVVSSMAILFSVVNANSDVGMQIFAEQLQSIGFNSLNAYCLMVFCLLYIPCVATLATVKKESGSFAYVALSASFQLVTAYVITFIIYNTAGTLFL